MLKWSFFFIATRTKDHSKVFPSTFTWIDRGCEMLRLYASLLTRFKAEKMLETLLNKPAPKS